jgi:hypothetical protein
MEDMHDPWFHCRAAAQADTERRRRNLKIAVSYSTGYLNHRGWMHMKKRRKNNGKG